jgi:alpha-L-fucosidase
MAVNGEALYGTRPWRVFGEGPATEARPAAGEAKFNEAQRRTLGDRDVRYTSKAGVLYAFCMGWPSGAAVFPALGLGGAQGFGRAATVELLGHEGRLRFTQDAAALTVQLPASPPAPHAAAFRIRTT